MGDVRPFSRRRRDNTAAVSRAPAVEPADAALIAAGRGDQAAFGRFYDLTADLVFGVVREIVRDPAMSEEVTQEVFSELWRLATRFDPDKASAKGWAATIAHRRAVDRVRSEQRRRNREEREVPTAQPMHDPVAEEVNDDLERTRVRRALATLTDGQREAVTMAYYGGHTYREVAVLLDVPEGTVKTRIRDGLIRLRDEFGVTT